VGAAREVVRLCMLRCDSPVLFCGAFVACSPSLRSVRAVELLSVIEFGKAFRKALEPYNPSDWVDVQSFIWCVLPDKELALPNHV